MKMQGSILSYMKFGEPMAGHTTFRIGGPADIWAEPRDLRSLTEIVALCRQDGIPIYVVGNGSNILIKDAGIRACIVNLSGQGFRRVGIEDAYAECGAGLKLAGLLKAACSAGLSGLEFLAGIPATVGGALVMNAGGGYKGPGSRVQGQGSRGQIGDFVEEVTVMDTDGRVFKINKDKIVFRYRGSGLEKYIVLAARFKLDNADRSEISDRLRGCLDAKASAQELDKPSAGCIFKNPPGDSAGRLIDLSGLKGRQVGDAMVSGKHANFIINAGRATCDNVLKLMDIIRKNVKKDHGILLEREIKILG